MVGGISIPTLNLPQAGRASMAPPSQYNSQSTLSQTQSLKKGISKKLKTNIGSYFKKELKGGKKMPSWNNSTMLDKTLGSFTDRSFKGTDVQKSGNVTMTEEDEEDMKEVMKIMNDQIVAKSKENL